MDIDLNDIAVVAWIKNETYPDGHLVFQPQSVLQKMKGVEYDFDKVQQLLNARVDVDRPRKIPQYILGQQTVAGFVNLFSLGNISLIQGKKKARKGFLSGLFIAALINKNPDAESGLYTIPLQLEKQKNKIVIIDTEQSEDDVIIATKRIMKLTGCDKSQIITLFARENTMDAKIEILELELRGRSDVLLVLIDGGVDMVTDSNNIEESSALVRDVLLPLSTKLYCHIMVVIHENKGNSEARGHLGLILGQKAECIIGVELTEGRGESHSTVRCIASRRKQFQPFMFEVRQDDLPYYVPDDVTPKRVKTSQTQHDTASTTHDNIIRLVFEKANTAGVPFSKFKELLKLELQGIGIKKVGRDSINEWVEYYSSTYKKIVVEGETSSKVVRQYGAETSSPALKSISEPKQSPNELF